jgi:DNA-binding CsgD family transcriptional regulator
VTETAQPLVGRDGDLAAIARLLDGLDRNAAVTLQIAGEPGIGKSRLMRELCFSARARGFLVLSGRAAEFEAELPFGVFSDAIDDWLLSLGHDGLAAAAGALANELAVVLPAFVAVASFRPSQLPEERYRAYRAVRGMLSGLAGATPVVVALDDVQWADPGSIELICHLLAHPPRGPVLLVLGFRPAQIPSQLTAAAAAALREQGTERLDLAPLSSAAAHALLGDDLTAPVRDRLCTESGGNPFFLLQLARGAKLTQRGPIASTDAAVNVPDAVHAALASELSSLSAPARVLLQGAAVAGDPFEELLAASAADVGEADVPDLIDELARSQLVYPIAAAGRFAFRHPIVRATVYESAGSGWRSRAHGRLAGVLAARGASASAQAPHVERSARVGDLDAVTVLAAAGATSALRAPALAARWYAAALGLLPDGAPSEARHIELLVAMATALGGSGQLEASRTALCEVLGLLPEEDPGRAPIVAYCAGVEHLLGRHRDAYARLHAAHRRIVAPGSVAAVALKVELATGCCYESRIEEMLDWAQQAFADATALEERPLQLVAAALVAYARYSLGLPAGPDIDRAGQLLDAIGDAELAGRLDGALWVGWAEAMLERFDRAIDHCQRAIDLSRATGQGAFLLGLMTMQAFSMHWTGRLVEAEELLAGAIESFRLSPNHFISTAVGISSLVATYQGDLPRAVAAAEEGLRVGASADPGHIRAFSGFYLAIPLIELGEPQRAYDLVLSTMGGEELPFLARGGRTVVYEVLTRAELALGHVDAAQAWALKADAVAQDGVLAVESAFASRAMAAVALARGDAPRAAQIALDAATRADGACAHAEAGRCRILGARALLAANRRHEAVAELQLAATELAQIGAHGYRAEAEKELRRLGRRVARRAADAGGGLTSLTERERDIADLVCRGRTNREIAATSYLSEKTVERHLSHIFRKLGVSSRTAVASFVAGDGDRGA